MPRPRSTGVSAKAAEPAELVAIYHEGSRAKPTRMQLGRPGKDRLRVGRGPFGPKHCDANCDYAQILSHKTSSISRQHVEFCFRFDLARWEMCDLFSTNGVYLNYQRVVKDVPTLLEHGDRIDLGDPGTPCGASASFVFVNAAPRFRQDPESATSPQLQQIEASLKRLEGLVEQSSRKQGKRKSERGIECERSGIRRRADASVDLVMHSDSTRELAEPEVATARDLDKNPASKSGLGPTNLPAQKKAPGSPMTISPSPVSSSSSVGSASSASTSLSSTSQRQRASTTGKDQVAQGVSEELLRTPRAEEDELGEAEAARAASPISSRALFQFPGSPVRATKRGHNGMDEAAHDDGRQGADSKADAQDSEKRDADPELSKDDAQDPAATAADLVDNGSLPSVPADTSSIAATQAPAESSSAAAPAVDAVVASSPDVGLAPAEESKENDSTASNSARIKLLAFVRSFASSPHSGSDN